MSPTVVSVIGAVTLLVLGGLLLAVILKSETVEERTRYGSSILAVFCAVVGAVVTAIFTHSEVNAARAEATAALSQASTTTQATNSLVATINSKPVTYTVGELKADSGFKDVVRRLNTGWANDSGMVWQPSPVPNDKKPGDMAQQKK